MQSHGYPGQQLTSATQSDDDVQAPLEKARSLKIFTPPTVTMQLLGPVYVEQSSTGAAHAPTRIDRRPWRRTVHSQLPEQQAASRLQRVPAPPQTAAASSASTPPATSTAAPPSAPRSTPRRDNPAPSNRANLSNRNESMVTPLPHASVVVP